MIQKLFEPAPCACQPEACSRQHGGSRLAGSHPSVPQVPESHGALVSIVFSAPVASTSSQAHAHHHHQHAQQPLLTWAGLTPGARPMMTKGPSRSWSMKSMPTRPWLSRLRASLLWPRRCHKRRPSVTRELLPRAGIILLALSLRMLYVLEAGACVGAARGSAVAGAKDGIIGR